MRSSARPAIGMVLVACGLALGRPATAQAGPPAGPPPDLASLLREETSILDALDRAVFEIRRAEMDLQNAIEAQTRLEARQAGALHALAETHAREVETRTRLHATLRLLAASGRPDVLRVLFGADEADEEARRDALLKRLSARQAVEWKAYTEAVEAARVVEFRAAIERANAHAAAQAAREARTRLETEARARREILAVLERDRALATRHAREVAQAHRDLVQAVQARLSSAPGPVDLHRLRGRLRWPLAGARVAIPFGDVVHPQFRTVTPHPGVTLAFRSVCPARRPAATCPHGNERNVRAVAFGRVVFAGRMRGYGSTVVLDHASGYYTVYGGLATVTVSEGAIVREGDLLGRVERVPGEEDLRLYFEVRRGREALDPAPFLATGDGGR